MLPFRQSLKYFWHPPSLSPAVPPRPDPRSPLGSCTLSYLVNIRRWDFRCYSRRQAELEYSLPSMVAVSVYLFAAHQWTLPRIAPPIEAPEIGAALSPSGMARHILSQECVLAWMLNVGDGYRSFPSSFVRN